MDIYELIILIILIIVLTTIGVKLSKKIIEW